LPEGERVLSPEEAVEALARYASLANNPFALMLEIEALERLIELVQPFCFLSPSLRLGHLLLLGGRALDENDPDRAEQHFRDALALLETKDNAFRHRTMLRCGVLFGLSHGRVFYADPLVLEWAKELDGHPLQHITAWRMRRFHHLFSGNAAPSQQCSERIEALSLESETVRTIDGGTVFMELVAAGHGGDLLQFGIMVERIAAMAERYPKHTASHRFAVATYERMRGNLAVARVRYEEALAGLRPKTHPVWPWGHEAYVETLLGLGETLLALRVAAAAFASATESELAWYIVVGLEAVLACAEAEAGETASALARMERIVMEGERRGLAPLLLSRHYERAARVALVAGEVPLAEGYTARLSALAERTENPVFLARASLLEASLRRESAPPEDLLRTSRPAETTDFRTIMTCPKTEAQRGRCALALLLSHSGACGGHLYRVDGKALVPVASSPDGIGPAPAGNELRVAFRAMAEEPEPVTQTLMTGATAAASQGEGGGLTPFVLSRPRGGASEIVGVALLELSPGMVARVPAGILDIACELLDPPERGRTATR
ncbi:MAG TPA: hypothetical protein VF395_12995, partial [Polyangiaceae bacterium]